MTIYRILDTRYPSKSVPTARPLVTYSTAHEVAMLRNIACGQPFRYVVKQEHTAHSLSTLNTGAL